MRFALSSTIVIASASAVLAQTTTPLLGVSFRADDFVGPAALYDVNAQTGLATNERVSNIDTLLGLTRRSDGTLFSLADGFSEFTDDSNARGALVTLNQTTGQASLVGFTGIDLLAEGDLDFDPTSGTLYGTTSAQGTAGIFTINTATGAASSITTLASVQDASAIAFQDDGTLWLLDTTFAFPTNNAILHQVDASTGAVVSSVTTDLALGTVAGMDFDPLSGVLYVADGDTDGTDNLYTLDLNSGIFTLVGNTGLNGGNFGFIGGLSGIEFIPAPSAASLLALAGMSAARRRRH